MMSHMIVLTAPAETKNGELVMTAHVALVVTTTTIMVRPRSDVLCNNGTCVVCMLVRNSQNYLTPNINFSINMVLHNASKLSTLNEQHY